MGWPEILNVDVYVIVCQVVGVDHIREDNMVVLMVVTRCKDASQE